MARKFFSRRLLAVVAVVAVAGTVLAGCSSTTTPSSGSSSAALAPLTLGSPGIPPVISSVLPYIASKQGFYKKYGLDVTIKSFNTGTDATRAVATGQIDAAIMPPAQVATLASTGSDLVGLQGMEFADWVIISTDSSVNSCQALKGQTIGVDAIGGIRYVALIQMLRTCGLAIADVHPLAFAGNANPEAIAAGQLKTSVFHLNEVYEVEAQGKKLTTVIKMSEAVPNTMYEMFGTTKAQLSKQRSTFVKLIAAQIATIKWMNDPANASAVAQYATVTGSSKASLLKAMADYRKLNFWISTSDAMPELNVNNMIKSQVAAGNVKAASAPTYADIVDTTVFKDAVKLVASKGD